MKAKIRKQISTCVPFVMNEEKYPSSVTASAFPLQYSNRYLTIHPPIVE